MEAKKHLYPKIPKVTEMRIGNFLFDDEYNIINIEQIHSDRLHYFVKVSKNGGEIYSSNVYMIPITKPFLEANHFQKDENGHYWRDFVTNYLELIPSLDGFYPLWCKLPEMSCESEQCVPLHRLQFVNELQNLFFAIHGEEIYLKVESSTCG